MLKILWALIRRRVRHEESEKSPPTASQLLYHVQAGRIHEARTLSKIFRARQYRHFTTPLLRRLLPTGTPYLSSPCHWEIEAARTWFRRYSWPLFILKQVQCAFQRLEYVSEGRRQSIRHRRLNIRSLDTLGLNGCGHY